MPNPSPAVIAPNLKRRLSGVTATIVRLVPLQARDIAIVATGWGLPAHVPKIGLGATLGLARRRGGSNPWRVWHARRNNEMLLGLVLRRALGKRLKLVFTSASQRRHTRYTRFLIARMDAVVATSGKTAAYLRVPATVIRHGIDTTGFAPAADKSALRRRMGLPDGFLVGCFGRIRHQKGTDVFIDALLRTLPEFPALHGVILGRATGGHAAFQQAQQAKINDAAAADRIRFAGEVPVDAIADWYRALDAFIAPQRWEGFGVTPLEAMACGVPVIATTVGAFEELVVDGQTGYLVPPGDVPAMAAALSRLAADTALRQRLGVAARAHVEAQFTLEREAQALNTLYRGLLADCA